MTMLDKLKEWIQVPRRRFRRLKRKLVITGSDATKKQTVVLNTFSYSYGPWLAQSTENKELVADGSNEQEQRIDFSRTFYAARPTSFSDWKKEGEMPAFSLSSHPMSKPHAP